MDITAASTERTIHIRICHHLWIRAFNMYIFKIPGFYECPISWVHFISKGVCGIMGLPPEVNSTRCLEIQ